MATFTSVMLDNSQVVLLLVRWQPSQEATEQ